MLHKPERLALTDQEHEVIRPVWADISLKAVTNNIQEIKKRIGRPVKIIAPVKADAYGHGIVEISKHLESLGVDGLATANVDDAILVRQAGVKLPILIYASQLKEGVKMLLDYDLTPTIYNMEAAQWLSANVNHPVNVHVKVDAGLGRIGVKLAEAREFIRAISKLPNIVIEGVYTHIAFSNPQGEAWSRRQLTAFINLIRDLKLDGIDVMYAQAAASAVILCDFPDELNTISPGHLVFGLCPVQKSQGDMTGFLPVLRGVKARLIHIAEHKAGDDIAVSGYLNLENAKKTGVILFGLDNGFRIPADKSAYMLCGGKKCGIISVTAEYTVIDLTEVPDAKLGDEVTIIGSGGDGEITIDQVAAYLNTTPAAFLVDLRRVPLRHSHS
jgi:alanine racemase